MLFWGCDPLEQPETKALFIKWRIFFDMFLFSVDRRTGSFLHLPFSGGSAEQPVKTMSALMAIQNVFFEKLNEQPQI